MILGIIFDKKIFCPKQFERNRKVISQKRLFLIRNDKQRN
jgi:hypothetical protein